MARIRTIKPDHFMDEALSEVSLAAHFLLSGLWMLADREGRLEDRPRFIKANVFPYRDVDVEPLLVELARVRRIARYHVDGVDYIEVSNWARDQRPHVREAHSTYPGSAQAQPRQCSGTTQASGLSGDIPASSPPRLLGSSNGIHEGDQGSGIHPVGALAVADAPPTDESGPPVPGKGKKPVTRESPDALMAAWNEHAPAELPRCREMTEARAKKARARLAERPLAEWVEVIRRLSASRFLRGLTNNGTWKASMDWLLQPDSAVKVLEGKYDDSKGSHSSGYIDPSQFIAGEVVL